MLVRVRLWLWFGFSSCGGSVSVLSNHGGHNSRGYSPIERQETNSWRRVRCASKFSGNRRNKSDDTRCWEETLYWLRSQNAGEYLSLYQSFFSIFCVVSHVLAPWYPSFLVPVIWGNPWSSRHTRRVDLAHVLTRVTTTSDGLIVYISRSLVSYIWI